MSRSRKRPAHEGALSRAVPNWDDVRFFLALTRQGSLSAAARVLGVTQSTCGRRLVALEESLGLRLFERTPRGLEPTKASLSLVEAALRMEQGAGDFALRVAAGSDVDGVVRIASSEAFACSFLASALPELRSLHPGIRVELVLSNDESDLFQREADLACRFRPEGVRPTPGALVARKLGDEPFFLYGAGAYLRRAGSPEDPDALEGHDVVVCSLRHPAADWCARAFRGASVVLSSSSMQVTGAAIAAGVGLGVLPERAARQWPHLESLSAVVARGTGWLVMHPDLRRVRRIRVVAEALAASFRRERRRS